MRPDVVRLGGFDSHTFPPPSAAVTPPVPPSRSCRWAACRRPWRAALLAGSLVCAALLPRQAAAQQRGSLRAGAAVRRDTTSGVDLPRPPISPRRAFLTSFL